MMQNLCLGLLLGYQSYRTAADLHGMDVIFRYSAYDDLKSTVRVSRGKGRASGKI